MKKMIAMFATISIMSSLISAKTYVVRTTADSGKGSLRSAIIKANKRDSAVRIIFSIPHKDKGYDCKTKTWCIKPHTPLPVINRTVAIDGFTREEDCKEKGAPEKDARMRIEISGSCCAAQPELTPAPSCNGIVFGVGAHHSSLEGIAITNFSHHGIVIGEGCEAEPVCDVVIKKIKSGINLQNEPASNGCNGIEVINSVNAKIESSCISHNEGIGIHQVKSKGTVIDDCKIDKNALGGVKVEPDCYPTAAIADYEVRFVNGCSALSNYGEAIAALGGTLQRLHK